MSLIVLSDLFSLSPKDTPNTPPVRLAGGKNSSEGRIEIFYLSRWGTVCSDHFGNDDAVVVCHQLGFSGVEEVVSVEVFGSGNGQVWIDNVHCTGYEERITDCHLEEDYGVHNCDILSDVGIRCSK